MEDGGGGGAFGLPLTYAFEFTEGMPAGGVSNITKITLIDVSYLVYHHIGVDLGECHHIHHIVVEGAGVTW